MNFTRFVEWPANSFKGPGDPIAICILGANPFTAALEKAAQGVVADSRSLSYGRSDVEQAHQCHIVFVSASERKKMRAVVEAVQADSVLTVGESESFVAAGGVIEFRLEDNRVGMEINAVAAKRAGLRISAKLLSLAQSGKR